MPLGPDLIYNKSIRESLSDIADFHGEVLFSPLLFKAEDLGVDLDQCRLSTEELTLFARIATRAKERFTNDASGDQDHGLQVENAHGSPMDVDELSLNRGYCRKKDIGKRLFKDSGLAELDVGKRRKTLKKHQLSADEIEAVVSSVRGDKLSHNEAARKHQISPRLVQSLASALKKDPEFLQRARKKEMKGRQKLRAVITEALKHLNSKAGLFKAKQVSESVLEEHGIVVSNQYVCSVLRNDIGARFKLIRKIPYLGNHNRCLQLRQLYAKFMLRKLAAGVRVINVDQTWINDMFLTRRKWRMRGATNSWAEKPVNPRIAV